MNIVKYEKMIDEKLAMLKEEMMKEMMQKFEEKQENEFPKVGDEYYYLNASGDIRCVNWVDDEFDRNISAIGNISSTEEEMKFKRERLKVIKELEKYAEKDKKWGEDTHHYYIIWNYDYNKINYYSHSYLRHADIYFESLEKAREAVEMVGEDRIKKYYLRVED